MVREKEIIGSLDRVDAHHSDYSEWLSVSHLPRTILGGTRAIRKAGKFYLPQEPMEKPKNYENRLLRSFLINMYGKTVNFLSGQVFTKASTLDENAAQEIVDIRSDIDLQGNSFDTFLKRAFETGIGEGVVHMLAGSTNTGKEYVSKADERADGIRPFLRMIKGENLFGFVDIDGELLQIRIMETAEELNGRFGITIIPQIRVIEPGKWEIYRLKKGKGKDAWSLYDAGDTSLDYIPLSTFIPGKRMSMVTGETPLSDLADLQLAHYHSYSDQRNILHYARMALLFAKGIDMKTMEMNAAGAIGTDNKDADMKYVEISGKAIEAGQKDLTEMEAKIALYGLQQLIPRSGNQTATEKALSSAESNSNLGTWVSIFEADARRALGFCADFDKTAFDPEHFGINKDFSTGIIDPEMISAYTKLVDAGILSAASAFNEIRKKGFISEELDWQDVQAEMDLEKKDSEGKSLSLFGK